MLSTRQTRWQLICVAAMALAMPDAAFAQSSGNRLLGLDVSAYQGDISQTTWNNIRNVENRQFVFIRSSRGGTTGEDHRQGGYPAGNNTFFNLSQRYDDPYFIQNITRATTAGMFAGSYHFSRPDVIATTPNSGGIANTGIDEANHFIQMAGAFMRPGYLPPVHDFEAGDGIRTSTEMAQYALDFSNRIYEVMRIRPAIYVNGNYADSVLGGATATQRSLLAQQSGNPPNPAGPAYSQLWSARWPNQGNPNSIPVQTAHPGDSISWVYGPWDDYGVAHPWVFWQYASTGRLNSFNNGNSNLDFNVVNGGVEYLKDQLVPAVWWNDSSGNWSTLANWNSGQAAIVPISSPGQLTPAATGPLPTPRLPGATGSGPTAGRNDTVILDRPNADITVTLSAGSHNIRKLYVREILNITGGSLTVNYVPVAESTPMAAQFSAPVSISGGANLSVHTLHVDPATNFTAGNATLTFDSLRLDRGTTPAKLVLNGNVSVAGLFGATAKIGTNAGVANTGLVDLSAGVRAVNVANGAAAIDLAVSVPIVNGGLTKSGAGTMSLSAASTYAGGTTISGGTLIASNTTGSATGTNSLIVALGGTLAGGGTTVGASGIVSGLVTVQSGGRIAPGSVSSSGILNLAGGVTFNPGSIYDVNLNSTTLGSGYDQLRVTGTATLAGNLNVTLGMGFTPLSSDSFTILSATNISGTFANPYMDLTMIAGLGIFKIHYSATTVVLTRHKGFIPVTPVPEPTTILTFAAGAALTVRIFRRRRKGATTANLSE